MFKNLIIIVLILLVNLSYSQSLKKYGVDEEQYLPKGLNVGEKAPVFNVNSIDGVEINTNAILQEKELVIIFYRGDWCPVCSRYLSNFNDSLKYIQEKGAEVLVIGPETSENAKNTQEKTEADFIIISDSTQQIAKSFDVLFDVTKGYSGKVKTFLGTDIADNNGSNKAQLPVPATFVIGKDGVIKYKQFDFDYKNRASVKEIIEHIK